MKKNRFKIGSFAFLFSLGLTSCNSEAPVAQQSDATVVDLNNFTFAEVKSMLKAGTAVVLKDGESHITVSRFTELQGETVDADGSKVTSYQANDSVSVSLAHDFASVKVSNRVGYVAYADATDMQVVTKTYGEMAVATKAGQASVTRSASGSSMKIDIQAARNANAALTKGATNTAMEHDFITVTPEQKKACDAMVVNTKAVGYQFPRNKVVTIHLLISSGACKPIPHELVWQQEDAQRSISDVFKNDKANAPKLVFKVQNCGFKGTEKATPDLHSFYKFVQQNASLYPEFGKDVYFLIRQWGWGYGGLGSDSAVGISYSDTYHINSLSNSVAFGMSATSCLYSSTLAHELGHVFGVKTHSTTPWYRCNTDIMNATNYSWVKEYHRTDINQGTQFRNAIYSNLKQQ